MKKRICIVLCLLIAVALMPFALRTASAETYSGKCGDNLNWSFNDSTGKLTITGSGAMYEFGYTEGSTSYSYEGAPWAGLPIQKVSLPSGLTSIGWGAFDNCTELTSVTIPDSVTRIGDHAFNFCSKLTSIKLGSSLQNIGSNAFNMCQSLTTITIPDSVTEIGRTAFANCSGLTSVTIGSGVQRIGEYAFSSCSGLTSVKIGSGLKTIGDYAFYRCEKLTTLTIPSSVTSIGIGAFRDCTALTSITIPNSVTEIGYAAFAGCTGLTSVKLGSGIKSIGDWAFGYCEKLTTITIPNSVTEIGYAAFAGCSGLTSVTLGSGLKTIGDHAFSSCTGLTSITIPASVTSIGDCTFNYCTGLTKITVSSQNKKYCSVGGVLFSYDKTKLIVFPCSKAVESYTIPDSVTSLGTIAFNDCTVLKTVTIPANLNDAVGQNFSGSFSLTAIKVSSQNTALKSVDGVLFSYDKTSLIAFPAGKSTSYTIPNYVKNIGDCAFFYCKGLVSITIPSSVTSIGYAAFQECTALTSITIPNSVTSIGDWAFAGCTALTSITIPNSVTSIGGHSFYSCDSLKTVKLGSGVKSISDWTFGYCEKLTSITIPNSVTSIGDYAFYDCEGLTSATLGSGLKTIGIYAFDLCVRLKSITIPNSVTSIGEYAFLDCTGLTSVKLGSGVKDIGGGAFGGCENLKKVLYCGMPEQKESISLVDWGNQALTSATWYYIIGTQPKSATVKTGETAKFTVTVFSGVSGVTYQWYYSKDNGSTWTKWSGKTSASLSLTGSETNNGYLYRCEVTNSYGSVTSKSAKLTVSGVKPKITAQPAAQTVASGKAATFKVVAAGSGLSYQWQYSKNNGSTWTSWSGKTSATLSVTGSETNNGYLYRCVVKNSYGSVTSGSAKLTVSGVKPKITAQPAAQTVASGKAASFKVVAAGSGLSYQWQYSKNNGSTWTSWSGKTSATLSVTGSETNNGYLYRCEVTNSYGSVTSSSAKLTVSGVKPKITVQPTSQTVTSGKAVTFKVVAAGSGLSYQWQYSKNNGSTWTSWSGKTSATLSVTGSETNNGYLYRCEVTNSYGSVTSSSAKLTVSGVKPKITAQPAAQTVASGKAATFKVVAAGSGLSYQWQYSKNNGSTWTSWSGKTSASLSLIGNEKNNGYQYRCVVTNSYGSVTSSSAKLTVE